MTRAPPIPCAIRKQDRSKRFNTEGTEVGHGFRGEGRKAMREAREKISDGGESRFLALLGMTKFRVPGTADNRDLTTSKGFLQRLKPVL